MPKTSPGCAQASYSKKSCAQEGELTVCVPTSAWQREGAGREVCRENAEGPGWSPELHNLFPQFADLIQKGLQFIKGLIDKTKKHKT